MRSGCMELSLMVGEGGSPDVIPDWPCWSFALDESPTAKLQLLTELNRNARDAPS